VSAICTPEVDPPGVSEEGSEEATAPGRSEGGDHPARRLSYSVDLGRSGGTTTPTNLGKAVRSAQCACDGGPKDLPDPTTNEPLVDISRLPVAAMSGAPSISGIQTAVDGYTAIDPGESGTRVR
jgi:hypothetical protein